MAVKLADAFVQITASAEGLQRDISKQLSGLGKVGQDAGKDIAKAMSSEVEKAGKSLERSGKSAGGGYGAQFAKEAQSSLGGLGDRIIGGLGKGMLAGAAVAGTAVAGTLGAAIGKGFSRLTNIDQAEAKLRGLGNSAQDVAAIMESANVAVKGTAFGLDEAATTAASAVAAGIEPGAELQRTLTLMGDAATIAGTDMSTMGAIVNKVATSDMMQMDVANQLMDAGIPILQMVADEMGVTADEARKMASEGEISFEIFQNALENGLGGAAQESGTTFQGALANMGAAMGRFGASITEPVFENLPVVFGAVGDAFGLLQEKIGPLAEDFGEWLAPRVQEFAENLGPWLVDTVERMANAFSGLSRWLQDNAVWLGPVVAGLGGMAGVIGGAAVAMAAYNKAMAIYDTVTKIANGTTKLFNNTLKTNVIILVVSAIAALVAGLVYFFTQTETGQKVWKKFTDALGAGVDWIKEKWESFTGWFSDAWNGITSLFKGDYTAELGKAFGLEEDSPVIKFFFTVRDLLSDVKDYVTGVWDILFKGDYTGLPFGLEEDSGLVKLFFNIREAAIKTWEIIQAFWDGIVTAGQVAVTIISTVVITPLVIAWNLLSSSIQWAWENVIQPVWSAISTFATETLWPILQSVFTWIGEKWQQLSDIFGVVWGWLRDNVFQPLTSFVTETLWPALESAFTWIGDKWQWLSDVLTAAWDWIRENVFNALMWVVQAVWDTYSPIIGWMVDRFNWLRDMLGAAWTWINDNVFSPLKAGIQIVADWFSVRVEDIRGIWQAFQDLLHAGWRWVSDNVFDPIGRGLDTVKGWFQTGVDAIGTIWDGLKKKLAEPINFVIRVVYTDGIKKVFDGVAEKVGLDSRLPDIPLIGGYARGGILPGFSRMRDGDDQLVPMRRGEGVLVSEGLRDRESRELFLAANEAAKSGMSFANYLARAGYATGGIINYAGGGMSGVQASHARFVGKYFPDMFALTSTNRNEPGSYHDFGVQKATDWQAQDGQVQTQMPTAWSKALARAIFTNFPGTAELIHHPLDGWQNLDNGAPFDFGPATNAGHGNHVHWATHSPLRWEDGELVLDDVPGAGAWFNPANWFSGLWDRIIGVLPKFDGEGFGDWAKVPGAALSTLGGWVKDWALEKLASLRNLFTGGDGGGGAQQWSTAASEALRRAGYDDSLLDITLQQVDIESSGIPNNQNNWDSNAIEGDPTVGLLQVKGTTFQMMRNMYPEAFVDLPNDRTDPVANMTAGILWSKYRYGGPQNVWPTRDGYAAGGIVGMPELFTRDLGGIVPHGALVRNTSGRDELMLPPETTALMNQFFKEFPEVAQALTEAMDAVERASITFGKAMDFTSMEGITARQTTRAVLGMGIEIPGADLITGVLDAEQTLWDGRARHVGHLTSIEDKQLALEEAQQRLLDLQGDSAELTTQQQRKLDDAQKAVDEAKAGEAEADTDEKRAKATEKVADAEEKLRRVREDLDEEGVKSAEKRAEEVVKANDDIMKAETELNEARKAQIMDLDHIVVLSQQNVADWGAQATQVGDQLVSMGVSASVVSQGLGTVSGALGAVSAMAGPAGITLGMALEAVKLGIQLVQLIEGIIKDAVAKFTTLRTARLQVFSDYLVNIAQINALVSEQKQRVVDLAASWIDATVAMADAVRAVTTATGGIYQAALDGAKGIAEIQQKIRDTRAGMSGGGESSGSVPWDMGLLYDSYANVLTAAPRTKPKGSTTQDIVAGLREIAALQSDLFAAEINAQILMKQAYVDLLTAQYEQNQAQVALIRLEEDLARQVRHLNALQEIQVQFAMNEQQALLGQAWADMAMKVAESEATMMDIGNRIGAFLDFDRDGKVFGLFTNVGSASMQAAEAQKAAALAQMQTIEQMAGPYGGLPSMGDLEPTIDMIARLTAAGEDTAAAMLMWGSALGDPARMLQITELETTLRGVDENQLNLSRSIEDMASYWAHIQEIMPLQEEIYSLEHERDAHTAQAEALRATSEDVKLAAEALRDFHHEAASAKPQVVTVSIPSRGQMVDPDDIDAAFYQLGSQVDGLEFRVRRVEESGRAGAGAVMESRR